MKSKFIPYLFLVILIMSLSLPAWADVVILKSGQVIKDVKVSEQGNTVYCESKDRTYYINKDSIESIIRTDKQTIKNKVLKRADGLLASLPPKAKKYINDYPRLIIAGIICVLAAVLAVFIIYSLLKLIKLMWVKFNKRHRLIRYVKKLDEQEKAVLREFIIQGQNTMEMPVEDKTVAGLIYKGVLEKIGSKGEYSVRGPMLPVVISPVAKKHMNPQMLGMPSVLTDETRQTLAESRPQFIRELADFYRKLERKNDFW